MGLHHDAPDIPPDRRNAVDFNITPGVDRRTPPPPLMNIRSAAPGWGRPPPSPEEFTWERAAEVHAAGIPRRSRTLILNVSCTHKDCLLVTTHDHPSDEAKPLRASSLRRRRKLRSLTPDRIEDKDADQRGHRHRISLPFRDRFGLSRPRSVRDRRHRPVLSSVRRWPAWPWCRPRSGPPRRRLPPVLSGVPSPLADSVVRPATLNVEPSARSFPRDHLRHQVARSTE